MQEIMNCIQEEYRTITLEQLSLKFYLSVPYLSKYIREKSGKTFSEILTDVRMTHACVLLETEGLPVEQVARRAGYPSVEHFSRQFKKRYGQSPAAWRNP